MITKKKISPANCPDIYTLCRLNEQGIKINDDSIVVRPNSVFITRGHTTMRIPMSLFKTFAEWYLEEQELNDEPVVNMDDIEEFNLKKSIINSY